MKRTPSVFLLIFLTACNLVLPSSTPEIAISPPAVSVEPPSPLPAGEADLIFSNGIIITMEDSNPSAEAVAIQGNKIAAVGSNAEILKLRGAHTILVDLNGKILVPGFIDAHQHRIGDRGKLGYTDANPVIQMAIEQGWTTVDELYVDQGRLDELRHLDQASALRLHVNAYLPVNENSAEGKLLGDWYSAYQPGEIISPHVRVAGLKVFTDFNNATVLLWKQADLNAFLLKEHRNGWQLAIKTVSTRSLEMILQAIESIEAIDPNVVNRRVRLEHALFITPEQIARIKHLGIVPIINLNNPGQLVGDPDVDTLIAREPQGAYTPWRSLVDAGIPVANASGWPSYYVDEPTGAPFGSPIHLIYQAVTRIGNLGTQPYPSLLDQTLTAEQAMRALTINGAYVSFEEDGKGSLKAGKLADMVILSGDPLTVPTREINNIKVLMTMIDGKVEFCASGFETLCPAASTSPNPIASSSGPITGPVDLTSSASVSASAFLPEAPPLNTVDGNPETIWNSGAAPKQWIRFEFDTPRAISAVRLKIAQYPEGYTVHRIWGGDAEDTVQLLHEFAGNTADGQTLEFHSPAPIENVRILYIVTTESPSWVAWREIEVIGQ